VTGQVFISYQHRDRTYVDRLAAQIAAEGLPLWYDYEIATGDRFEKIIKQQIEACSAFVVVMTPAAEDSEWVSIEVNFAKQRGKPVLPLLLEGEVFIRLNTLDYADVRAGELPDRSFFDQLKRLVGPAEVRPQPAPAPAVVRNPVVVAAEPGELIRTVVVTRQHPNGISRIELSPKGDLMALGGADGISVWDPNSGALLHGPTKGAVTSMEWLPDGINLLMTIGGSVGRLDATTGAARRLTAEPATGAAMSRDGRQLATAHLGEYEGQSTTKTWDAATGAPRLTLSTGAPYYMATFSPDGRQLVAAGYGPANRLETRTPLGVDVELDHGQVHVEVWNTSNGTAVASLTHGSSPPAAPTTAETLLRLSRRSYRTPSRQAPLGPERWPLTGLAYRPDGVYVLTYVRESAGMRLRWFSTENWRAVSDCLLRGATATISRDWRRAATGTVDRTALVWNLTAPKEPVFSLGGHGGPVTSLGFSPDGRMLATACSDGVVRMWRV
jgi:WD40 repeat protein